MLIIKLIALTTLSASLVLAAPNKREKQIKNVVELGTYSSKILTQTLSKKMKKKLVDGGVMKALEFCSDEAFNLTEAANKKIPRGVRIKRISLKYRNPANAPKDGEAAILESFQTLKDANAILPKYVIQQVDSKTDKYYEPIFISNKACLECHGQISKDVDLRRKVAARYPIDKAVNYEVGDLRGAIVVTVQRK